MNILAIEPYYSGSHKAFLNGIVKHSRHHILPVKMQRKGSTWKMQGGSFELADQALEISESQSIDLIVAGSTTNLAEFLALTKGRFAHTPILLYMHENQLTQPLPDGEERDVTYCYNSVVSAMAANRLIFTSSYHLQDFFEAVRSFLKRFKEDCNPAMIDQLEVRSQVVYPGLDLKRFDAHQDRRDQNDKPVIVWNQRWQFDRNPALFFRVLNRLDDAGFEFELILAGDNKHEKPDEFERAWKRYGQRIAHFGYVEEFEKYSKLLHRGDVVVSTATYEFFCTSVMEAIYCGCHPLVPNRLHYPELIPDTLKDPLLHAGTVYEDEDHLFRILRSILSGESRCLPKPSLQNINKDLDWEHKIEDFDNLFDEMVD